MAKLETMTISKLTRLRGDFELLLTGNTDDELQTSEISLKIKQVDDEEEY